MIQAKLATLSQTEITATRSWLADMNDLLGVVHVNNNVLASNVKPDEDLNNAVEALLIERQQARMDKNWGKADEIREALTALGVEVMDTAQGAKWKKIGGL